MKGTAIRSLNSRNRYLLKSHFHMAKYMFARHVTCVFKVSLSCGPVQRSSKFVMRLVLFRKILIRIKSSVILPLFPSGVLRPI